jgi:hypothetical protein
MSNNKRISNIAFIIIIISLLLFYTWRANNRKNIIKSDIEFRIGKVIKTSTTHRGAVTIEYSFFYNSLFQNDQALGIFSGLRDYFLNKTFPVVFSKKKPGVNEMLILPKDFERYNLQYPDSLRWVTELLDKNW